MREEAQVHVRSCAGPTALVSGTSHRNWAAVPSAGCWQLVTALSAARLQGEKQPSLERSQLAPMICPPTRKGGGGTLGAWGRSTTAKKLQEQLGTRTQFFELSYPRRRPAEA